MSGPKVVRVVTREELVDQGRILLARLQECHEQWRDTGKVLSQLSQDEMAEAARRLEEMSVLLSTDRFQDLAVQVPREIAFLEADLERRRTAAAAAHARKVARSMRVSQTAREVLRLLESSAPAVDPELRRELREAAAGQGGTADVERLLSRAFRLLTPETTNGLTEAQRALASRLLSGEREGQSLEQWKASRHPTAYEQRLDSLIRLISELSVRGVLHKADEFMRRLEEVRNLQEEAGRNLRLDTVAIEVSAAVEAARRVQALVSEARGLSAELETVEASSAAAVREKVNEAAADANEESMQAAVAHAKTELTTALKARGAVARRRAVLRGLAQLGYSVHEGMETAWASSGRIVVRKQALPGYGVELAADPEAQRLQLRSVALSEVRDTSRDVDAETLWCSDFSKLKSSFTDQGSDLKIEKAFPVGAVPLKVAASEGELGTRLEKPAGGLQSNQR